MFSKKELSDKEVDELIQAHDKSIEDVKKAMASGKQHDIVRAKKHNAELKARLDKFFAGQKSSVKGMSPLEMHKASMSLGKALEQKDIAKQEIASDTDNSKKAEEKKVTEVKNKTGEEKKEGTIVDKVSKNEVIDSAKANVLAESNKDKEQVNEEAKAKEVKLQADKTVSKVNESVDKKEQLKVSTANERSRSRKKELVPKAWQRVTEDGTLTNVITFLGEKVDYEAGLKHKYKFPNLSVSDGLTRIVTAKYPKEQYTPKKQEIEFRGYKINIDKYGSSAVCTLHDPDGLCTLEFVSLATVIDVLQDELNEGDECWLSWGTIDQIIKKKRGLRSRIKDLNEDDLPANSRKFNTAKEDKIIGEPKQEAKKEEGQSEQLTEAK